MAKGGRQSAFRKEYCELARNYAELGATDKKLAEYFNVSEKTLNTWKEKYPEFLQPLKEGKAVADAKVVQALYNRATGYSHPDTKFATHEGKITDREEYVKHYPPDTTACIFWLKNRQREKWTDRSEVSHSISGIGDLIDEIQAAS